MTKKILHLLILTAVISFSACKQNFDTPSPAEDSASNQDGKAYIRVVLNSNDRTVLPAIDKEDFDSFTLRGIYEDEEGYEDTLVNFGTWNSYSELSNQTIEVDKGNWHFILSAAKGENNYADIISKTISKTDNQLSFNLKHGIVVYPDNKITLINEFDIEEGKGNLELIFNYDKSIDINSATATFYTAEIQPLEEYQNLPLSISQSDDKNTASLNIQDIDSGIYLAKFKFYYDQEKTLIAQTLFDYIYVSKDLTSKETIQIPYFYNQYTVTYETYECEWNDNFVPQNYFTKVIPLKLPVAANLNKDNMSFEGWYYDEDFQRPVTTIPLRNIKLYAKIEKTYSANVWMQNESDGEYTQFKTINATTLLGQKCSFHDIFLSDLDYYMPSRFEGDIITGKNSTTNIYIDSDYTNYQLGYSFAEDYLDPYYNITLKIPANSTSTYEDIISNLFKDYKVLSFNDYSQSNPDNPSGSAVFAAQKTMDFYDYVNNYQGTEFSYTADGNLSYGSIINIIFNNTELHQKFDSIRLDLRKAYGVTAVEEADFISYDELKEFVVPECVTIIFPAAFGSKLESLTITKNVKTIGSGVFGKNLSEVIFEDPENWHTARASYNQPLNKQEDIDPEVLSDPEKAAQYVKNWSYWYYKGDTPPVTGYY